MTRSEAEGLLDPFGLEKNGVKKAFRKAALYWHPDKGGDAEMFGKMMEARDVLLEKEEQDFDFIDVFAQAMRGWRKPEGPFAEPFQNSNFWQEQARGREVRTEAESRQAEEQTAKSTAAAEKKAKIMRAYGVKGTIHFIINGQKFDIFL